MRLSPTLQRGLSLVVAVTQLSDLSFGADKDPRTNHGDVPGQTAKLATREVVYLPNSHFGSMPDKTETILSQHRVACYLLSNTNLLVFDEAVREPARRENLLKQERFQRIDADIARNFASGVPTNSMSLTPGQKELLYYPGAAAVLLHLGKIDVLMPTISREEGKLVDIGAKIIAKQYRDENMALRESPEFRFLAIDFKERALRDHIAAVCADPAYRSKDFALLYGVGHAPGILSTKAAEYSFKVPKEFEYYLGAFEQMHSDLKALLAKDRRKPLEVRAKETEDLVNRLLRKSQQ